MNDGMIVHLEKSPLEIEIPGDAPAGAVAKIANFLLNYPGKTLVSIIVRGKAERWRVELGPGYAVDVEEFGRAAWLGALERFLSPPAQAEITEEPVFRLRAQDIFAPYAVRHWAETCRVYAAGLRLADSDHALAASLVEQAEAADAIAARMVAWQAANSVKFPD